MSKTHRGVLYLIGFAPILLAGCTGSDPPPTPEEIHIKKISILYGQYTGRHKGVGPENAKQLRAFAKGLSADQLQSIGIEPGNLDNVFVSPRDKQEYVFRKINPQKAMSDPATKGKGGVVVYEKVGDGNGNRYVAFSLGAVEQVSQEEFKKMVPEAK